MARYEMRHKGPWPDSGDLHCDHCDKTITRRSGMRAWWNPYGPFGWTVLCAACDAARVKFWEEIDWLNKPEGRRPAP